MEQISIKELNLKETDKFLTELNFSSKLKEFSHSLVSSIFQLYEDDYSADVALALILYNTKSFEELFVTILTFLKRHQNRSSGEIFKRLDEVEFPNTLLLNLDPEKSVLGPYVAESDAEFISEILVSSLQDNPNPSIIDVVTTLVQNPLSEVSNWSTLSQILFIITSSILTESGEED